MLAKECLFKMYTRESNFLSSFLFEGDMSCIFISSICRHITHMFPGGVRSHSFHSQQSAIICFSKQPLSYNNM